MTPRRLLDLPRGVVPTAALLVTCVGLTAGWFATGHASAPDDGLLQLDVLSLSEPVPGPRAGRRPPDDGRAHLRPRRRRPAHPRRRVRASPSPPTPTLARRVALPAATACEDGYVLLDAAGLVRYRSYDPGWPQHAEEQEILLEHLDHGP